MQRAAISSRGNFRIGGFGLGHGAILREGDEKMQRRIEASNSLHVHFRQRD